MTLTATFEDEPAPEPDDVATSLAWAFVVAFGLWAGWGWLAQGVSPLTVMLAVVFGLFQIATNILAVKVRELAGRGAWATCLAAFLAMIASGLLTHESLDHAYATTQALGLASADPGLMSWLLLAVPFLEPLLFWINKVLSEPPRRRAAQIGLLPFLWALLVGPGPAIASPSGPALEAQRPAQTTMRISRTQMRAEEPARAQARLLLAQGQKVRAVHDATGVPLSTLKRWARA